MVYTYFSSVALLRIVLRWLSGNHAGHWTVRISDI